MECSDPQTAQRRLRRDEIQETFHTGKVQRICKHQHPKKIVPDPRTCTVCVCMNQPHGQVCWAKDGCAEPVEVAGFAAYVKQYDQRQLAAVSKDEWAKCIPPKVF